MEELMEGVKDYNILTEVVGEVTEKNAKKKRNQEES